MGVMKVSPADLDTPKECRIVKRAYEGDCIGCVVVGRWHDCMGKRELEAIQAKRMVHDVKEWGGLVRVNAWGGNHPRSHASEHETILLEKLGNHNDMSS